MDWIVRNISFLAFLLVAVSALGIVVRLLHALGNVSHMGMGSLFAHALGAAIALIAIAVGYGLLVRFLGLCDDMAALRRTQTGTKAALD